MTFARIYRAGKSAMQAGKAQMNRWMLDYEPAQGRFIEPLMGWTGTDEPRSQVRLEFDSKEKAIAYAEKHGLAYDVEPERPSRPPRRAYADNFAPHRLK